MPFLGAIIAGFANLVAWSAVPALAEPSTPPAALLGTWDVERVEADRQDQMHWGIRPGDPRLLGRELVVSKDSVRFSAVRDACQQGSWPSFSATWPDLFKRGFLRAATGGRSAHPRPADFRFTPPSSGPAKAYLLCPAEGQDDPWLVSRWVALTSTNTLVMHHNAQVLLVLKRRTADAKPQASFSCAKASSKTEEAICASIELASLDRSVAAAYRDAIKRDHNRQDELRKDQEGWLKERDGCATDVACLRKSMFNRVESLTM